MALTMAVADPLATAGQIAAIFLVLVMFIFIVILTALAVGLGFGLGWVREKAELIKKIRPMVDGFNRTGSQARAGTLPEAGPNDNQLVRNIAEAPTRIASVEKKIEEGSDRVANVAIEFRARTLMAKQMAKTFFLPGLVAKERRLEGERQRVGEPLLENPSLYQLTEPVPERPALYQAGGSSQQALEASQRSNAPTR